MKLLYLDYPHTFILLNLAVVYLFLNSIDHYFYLVEYLVDFVHQFLILLWI